MKRNIIFFLLVLMMSVPFTVSAQSNINHVAVGVGLLYERGLDLTLSMEHETKYHNSWEYFINGYLKWDECDECGHVCPDSFWNNYNTWAVGLAYKPCVSRSRNSYSSLRMGGSVGSDTDKFLGGVHIGYEKNIALRNGWGLFVQAKCDLILPKRMDLFRTGLVIGFKIPTNK